MFPLATLLPIWRWGLTFLSASLIPKSPLQEARSDI